MNLKKHNSQRYIYLADDDADDREFLVDAILEVDPSITLTQAADGMELMNILIKADQGSLPEIVFLDINMPKKDGFECLEAIRMQKGSLKKLKVIILSTSNNPKNIEKAFYLGATFYAVKPNSFDVMKSLVKEVLQMDWELSRENRSFRLI